MTIFNSTQQLLSDMAEILRAHGVEIWVPSDGDLDDAEMERYEGLVAVLDLMEKRLAPAEGGDKSQGE